MGTSFCAPVDYYDQRQSLSKSQTIVFERSTPIQKLTLKKFNSIDEFSNSYNEISLISSLELHLNLAQQELIDSEVAFLVEKLCFLHNLNKFNIQVHHLSKSALHTLRKLWSLNQIAIVHDKSLTTEKIVIAFMDLLPELLGQNIKIKSLSLNIGPCLRKPQYVEITQLLKNAETLQELALILTEDFNYDITQIINDGIVWMKILKKFTLHIKANENEFEKIIKSLVQIKMVKELSFQFQVPDLTEIKCEKLLKEFDALTSLESLSIWVDWPHFKENSKLKEAIQERLKFIKNLKIDVQSNNSQF